MGTTAHSGLPYPDATDLPMVHLDMQALAEEVDERLPIVAGTQPAPAPARVWQDTSNARIRISNGVQFDTITLGPRTVTGGRGGGTTGAGAEAGLLPPFAHGLGIEPTSVTATPTAGPNDTLSIITKIVLHSVDATNIQLRFARTDTSAWLEGNVVGFHWQAVLL